MRDCNPILEKKFFELFTDFFDSEKDAGKQHDPENYSLDRLYPLAALAGNPEKNLKIIHIAGTKGKGSTCFYIAALLQAAGKSSGVFNSPHLATVRERFQVRNQMLPYERLMTEAESILMKIREAGLKPSLFEIFTVMALKIFADEKVEYAVMETGIGGRLDATNYVRNPVCTVITPVSFDHMALLGNTIGQIASEKAGILKEGCPVVLSRQPYMEASDVILKTAGNLHCPVWHPADGSRLHAYGMDEGPAFLQDNFRTALRVMQLLKLEPVPGQFRKPVLRARCEEISRSPLVILDAAHNADSMEKLVQAVNSLYPGIHFTIVLGVVKNKDVRGIAAACRGFNGEFILTNPHTGKGSALEELRAAAAENHLGILTEIPDIRSRADLPERQCWLFTGSFFTALIGEELYGEAQDDAI